MKEMYQEFRKRSQMSYITCIQRLAAKKWPFFRNYQPKAPTESAAVRGRKPGAGGSSVSQDDPTAIFRIRPKTDNPPAAVFGNRLDHNCRLGRDGRTGSVTTRGGPTNKAVQGAAGPGSGDANT